MISTCAPQGSWMNCEPLWAGKLWFRGGFWKKNIENLRTIVWFGMAWLCFWSDFPEILDCCGLIAWNQPRIINNQQPMLNQLSHTYRNLWPVYHIISLLCEKKDELCVVPHHNENGVAQGSVWSTCRPSGMGAGDASVSSITLFYVLIRICITCIFLPHWDEFWSQ